MIKLEKDKLKLWSVVCIISAIPSFFWGLLVLANITAMIVGVLLFIIVYTIVSSSNFYKKLKEKAFLFKALRWGFGIRIFYSIIALISMPLKNDIALIVNITDWWLGSLSVALTNVLLGRESFKVGSLENPFFPTLLTTITQGTLLSLAVFAVAVIIWCFFRLKHIISPTK